MIVSTQKYGQLIIVIYINGVSKVWSVDQIIIVIYCTYCAPTPFLYTLHSSQVMLWGLKRAERLPCIIIVIYINSVCYRGSSEMSQIYTHWWHFWRLLVTVGFYDSSLQKYGQFIIYSLSCSSVEFAIGGLQKCRKFIRRGHTFWRRLVTVDFDDVSLQKYGQFII